MVWKDMGQMRANEIVRYALVGGVRRAKGHISMVYSFITLSCSGGESGGSLPLDQTFVASMLEPQVKRMILVAPTTSYSLHFSLPPCALSLTPVLANPPPRSLQMKTWFSSNYSSNDWCKASSSASRFQLREIKVCLDFRKECDIDGLVPLGHFFKETTSD